MIPATRLEFLHKIRSLNKLIRKNETSATNVINAILSTWKSECFPLLPIVLSKEAKQLQKKEEIKNFSNWLIRQTFLESAYWLATAYANLIGRETRESYSMYFTPPKLADRVIDNLIENGACLVTQHWHDPACGGAAFLVPVAQRMAEALKHNGLNELQIIEKIEMNLSGSEIDKNLISLSKQFISMSLYSYFEKSKKEPNISLKNIDGLLNRSAKKLKGPVIICNPPYRKLKSTEATAYSSKFGSTLCGQPNIYGLFMHHAVEIASEGSLIGLLTPTSFLSGSSFSKLRGFLLARSEVPQIDMLSENTSLFISVDQQTAITVLTKKKTTQQSIPKIFSLTKTGKFHEIGNSPIYADGKPWAIPQSEEDLALLILARKSGARLKDYGYVAKIGTLVGYRDKRKRFKHVSPSMKSKKIFPLVWATDIGQDGSFFHGRPGKIKNRHSFVEISDIEQNGVITSEAVLLQRLTSSGQTKRLVATFTPVDFLNQNGGFIAENHVITLIKTKNSAWAPEIMASILNSKPIDRLFRNFSSSNNVGISELLELPLPPPVALLRKLDDKNDVDCAIETAFLSAQNP